MRTGFSVTAARKLRGAAVVFFYPAASMLSAVMARKRSLVFIAPMVRFIVCQNMFVLPKSSFLGMQPPRLRMRDAR